MMSGVTRGLLEWMEQMRISVTRRPGCSSANVLKPFDRRYQTVYMARVPDLDEENRNQCRMNFDWSEMMVSFYKLRPIIGITYPKL
jgi:hypothetical protein